MPRKVRRSVIQASLIVFAVVFISAGMPCAAYASLASLEPSTFPNSDLKVGLKGWWTFDGTDMRTNVADKSGNANTGFLIKGALGSTATSTMLSPGKIGQALTFDGIDDVVNVANTINPTFTVSFWMKTASSTTSVMVFGGDSITVSNNIITASWASNIYIDGNIASSIDTGWHFITTTSASSILADTISFGKSGSNFFAGTLDDIRFYNVVLTARQVKRLYNEGFTKHSLTPSTFPSPLKTGLTGWWTMDGMDTDWAAGKEVDKSGYGFTGALNSFSTSTSVVTGKLGQALAFNGINSYVSTGKAFSTFMSAATGTMSAWFYANGGNTTGCATGVMSLLIGDGTNTGGFAWLGYDGTNVCSGGFDGATRVISSAVPLHQWTHAVWVHNLGVISLWVNGALAGSVAAGNITDLTNPLQFGLSFSDVGFFSGYIDDVRMYSSALSTSTIQLLYNQGASSRVNVTLNMPNSPLQKSLLGWWTFDGSQTDWSAGLTMDKSGGGHPGNLVSMSTTTSPVQGKVGQAFIFNGTTAYVDVSNSSALADNLSKFSVSLWFKTKIGALPLASIIAKTNNTGANLNFTTGWGIATNLVSSNTVSGYIQTDQSNFAAITSPAINDAKWHHVVIVVNGSSIIMFLDGSTSGTSALSGGTMGSFTNTQNINIANDPYSERFAGSVDDVRIFNISLSTSTVQKLYYTGH